ncbi:hypothetical protein, partial [Faecalibaculum rodentium]|uniref:hypothetical protein n=1 Tax=Faecalibaculum rodentium TaxID=1702221 RepID=UPI00272A41B4
NLTKTRNFLTKSLNSLHNRPFLTQIQNIGCLFISTDLQSTAIPRIFQINRNTHPGRRAECPAAAAHSAACHHRQERLFCLVYSQKQYKTIENKSYFGILVSVNKTRSTQ